MKPSGFVRVFFITRRAGKIGPRRNFRVLRRKPKLFRQWWCAWWVHRLSGSPLVHVAVSYRGAVLDPGLNGVRFIPEIIFAENHPFLTDIVTVPVGPGIDLDAFASTRRVPAWPTFIRWLTRGLTPAPRDCVSIVAAVLRSGGVAVPRRITTPAQLFRWLKDHRFVHTPLSDGVPQGLPGGGGEAA